MDFTQDSLHPLTLFVDKERNQVIVAEASADFVDILFSFLTLPLGTIIRLISNEKNDQNVEIGCINNLYKSVENLDTQVFWNEICKEMLLRPRNPCETLCQKLKYKVDDTEPTKYFMCGSCRARNDFLLSTFAGANCSYCGKPMDKEMKLQEENHAKDDGVFVKGSTMYLIFDDLKVLPSSPANSVQQLTQLGYTDFTKLKPITLATGGGSKDSLHPLTLFVDQERNRVIMAEASAEFVDTLFSFLTLPLGTIIRLVSNDKNDQNLEIGCINNLYKTLENLDTQVFWNEICKEMLLRPRNPCETLCQKLIYNVDDTEPTKYFMCGNKDLFIFEHGNKDSLLSTFAGVKCSYCGKPMDKEKKLHEVDDAKDDGVFVKGSTMYLIFDDLKVLQNSPASSVQQLVQLGYTDFSKLKPIVPGAGKWEILKILKRALISKTVLTDVFLVDEEKGGYNSQPVCSFTHITPKPTIAGTISIPNPNVCTFKVTVSKSRKKILFAEAEGEDFDFLFSFLTVPVGSVLKLLGGNISLGSMENLYNSVKGLNSSWFTGSSSRTTPLLDLKVAPQYGCTRQPLQLSEGRTVYWYGTGVIRNNICYVDTNGVVSKSKNVIQSPGQMKLYDPRCADGRREYGDEGFVRKPSIFVVTDDLQVTPLNSASSLSFLRKLNVPVPLDDLEEHVVRVDSIEALNLLGASLTSKTALTNGLFDLLVKPKDEATL